MIKVKVNTNKKLLPVPDVRQSTDYTCGVASMLAILKYFKKFDGTESKLAKEMGATYDDGTSPEAIVKTAKKYGLKAEMKINTTLDYLKQRLKEKTPVIVCYQAWTEKKNVDWEKDYSDGHYSTLIGLDDKFIYLEDPSLLDKRGIIPVDEFLSRWHDKERNGKKLEKLSIAISGPIPATNKKYEKIK